MSHFLGEKEKGRGVNNYENPPYPLLTCYGSCLILPILKTGPLTTELLIK